MTRYLPQLAEAQIREACRQTHPFWGRGRTLEQHTRRTLDQMEAAGPALLRYAGLVDESGQLLCSLKRYAVLLAVPTPLGPRRVRAVGIGTVFSAEAHRGRGVATRLLEALLAESRSLGDEAAVLYSDIEPGFYARLGFTAFPAVDWSAPVAALPGEGALETRPAGPEDEPRLLDWYEASYPPTFLRPARDLALWRFFRWRNTTSPALILSEGSRDVGYVQVSLERQGRLWADEWGAPGIAPARVWATLRALAPEAGASEIRGWFRPDYVDARFTAARREMAIPMVADLTGALGLPAILPERTHFGSMDHF